MVLKLDKDVQVVVRDERCYELVGQGPPWAESHGATESQLQPHGLQRTETPHCKPPQLRWCYVHVDPKITAHRDKIVLIYPFHEKESFLSKLENISNIRFILF